MYKARIMIVEDEILIADTIKRYLEKQGYTVVGIARSYEEAMDLYETATADVWLLDIRLQGTKTGIDIATFLSQQEQPPLYIYLTSQLDAWSLSHAKKTFPSGYLSKPVHKESLYTTVEIALFNAKESGLKGKSIKEATLEVNDGTQHFRIPVKDIKFLEADHIYVKINVEGEKPILQRCPLREILDRLPAERFVQTHRSFAINLEQVSKWDKQHIYVDENLIPISRSRKKEVYELLRMG
ncbi:MAG: response regulator transcription factor [Bacteroidota bacterium]